VPEEEPHPISDVLENGFHDSTSSHVVAAILHQREIAEPPGGRASGLVGCQSLPFVFLGAHLQVELHLVADFSRNDITPEQCTPSRENAAQIRHRSQLLSTLLTAPVNRIQLSVSASNCARPRRVSL
jgi:hypothetical protein